MFDGYLGNVEAELEGGPEDDEQRRRLDAGTLLIGGRGDLVGHFDADLLRGVTLRPDDHRGVQTGHRAGGALLVGHRVDLRQVLRFVGGCRYC